MPDGLHADRQTVRVIAHREANGRMAGQIGLISLAHLLRGDAQVRPAVLRSTGGDRRSGDGGCRGQDRIHLAKNLFEGRNGQCADTLRLDKVRGAEGMRHRQRHAGGRTQLMEVSTSQS